MTENQDQPKGGSASQTISRTAAYAKAAKHFDKALDTLVWLLEHAHQESVRASAANKLIDKVLPDLKATEITGEDGGPIKINVTDLLMKAYGQPYQISPPPVLPDSK